MIVVGVEVMQIRTNWAVMFVKSGQPGGNFRIYRFLCVLGSGLVWRRGSNYLR